jgi:endoglucanase
MFRRMLPTTFLAIIAASGLLSVSAPAAQAAPDTQPPTTPGMPTANNITTTLATLVWSPSTDNVGVSGYTVQELKGGAWIDYTTAPYNVVTVSGLSAATSYTFAVIAHDAAGNNSARSNPVTFSTLPYGTGLTCSIFIQPFNNGYTVSGSILNMAPTVSNGWKLAFTLPANLSVLAVWNGTMTRTGDQATITNFYFTGAIYPGYSISIGFTGTSTGTFVPPSGFALNGTPCTVTISH